LVKIFMESMLISLWKDNADILRIWFYPLWCFKTALSLHNL
jgi:hypothetical protein